MRDPRDGLMLNLGYERAMQLANPVPVIGPGLSYEATKAINSVLYQRLQDQIGDDTTSQKINEERIRDINITNLASSNNINKSDLVAILQSGMMQGPQGPQGPPGMQGMQGPAGENPPPPQPPPRRPGRSGGPVAM